MPSLQPSDVELLRGNRPSPQEDHSTLSHLLNPWWEFAARFVPDTIAPNTLTVAGSLATLVPTLVQIHLAPTLSEAQPWWACIAAMLGVFLFQTLDALDGKQARRTRTSSPLGSWLDHALDILTIQFVFIGAAASMGMGVNAVFCFLLATVLLNNYLLHWEVHHTRLLYLGNGTSIAEAQVLCMAIHLATAVLGTPFWQQATPVAGLRYSDLLALVAVVGVGWSGMLFSVTRARSAGARWATLWQARGQLVLVMLIALAALIVADAGLLLMYLLGIGLLGARLVSELVLHNLLDRAPPALQWSMLVPGVLLCAHAASIALALPSYVHATLATLCLGFCIIVTLARLSAIARAMADALGIRIFSIR
ncbi:MAG TPA: CDP-alcohol phosphatidyltransferase family protein [Pseudomonadales bacterium]